MINNKLYANVVNFGTQLFNLFHMARAMLEYSKTVLKKVSFDASLFCRELKKAISILLPQEIEELKQWLEGYINDKPELQESLIYLKP